MSVTGFYGIDDGEYKGYDPDDDQEQDPKSEQKDERNTHEGVNKDTDLEIHDGFSVFVHIQDFVFLGEPQHQRHDKTADTGYEIQ